MLKKIYKLLINIKNKFWINTTNYKDFYSNISLYILNLIRIVIDLTPKKTIVIIVILIWIILFITNNITIERLIRFGIILIIICMYRILHKEIYKIYLFMIKYINITDTFLLKIYRYKNPIILILIEIELVLFHIIRYIQINNFQSKYITFIYHILYNISGLNGLKIVLAKIYKVLLDWKNYGIYELLFKRIYGMVLSVLIFTNIIKLIIMYLNIITNNYIIWIYLFLVIIPYIYMKLYNNISSLIDVEYVRIQSSLIWNILKNKNEEQILKLNLNLWVNIYVHPKFINNNIKLCIGLIGVHEVLNYDNFLIYLILKTNIIIKWQYEYLYIILQEYFDSEYLYVKKFKLHNNLKTKEDLDILQYCEYQILLYQLRVYYVWDIEKNFNINNTLLTVEKYYFNNNINDTIFFSYDYNFNEFKYIYDKKIKDIKLNKFFDLYHKDNYNFYKEMYNYLYDIKFKETLAYRNLQILKNEEDHMVYNIYQDISKYTSQEQIVIEQLKNWRIEWEKNQLKEIKLKYYDIFQQIENIKTQLIK